MLKSEYIDYQDETTTLEGYLVHDETNSRKKPAVLVAHDWSGKNEFARRKAHQLAELGYVGFALDMFGKGKLGQTKEEKTALIQPLMQDRMLLQKRMLAALKVIKERKEVNAHAIGAIGFCFGGLCVLDLARSGADVSGVVSFHGLLLPRGHAETHIIKAKVLALHGFDDPMVPSDQVIAFAEEMTKAKAKWEIDMYGHTMHAFTNPEANDPNFGTVYDTKADARSWIAMKTFFEEVFKDSV